MVSGDLKGSCPVDLYVFVQDKCNFSCSHCISFSSPTASKFLMSDSECLEVVDLVNKNRQIRSVHFTGGEPSLGLSKLKWISQNIRKEVKIHITTNGWFAEKNLALLDDLNLETITISLDKFHLPYIKKKAIYDLCLYYLDKGISEVALNVVFEDPLELADYVDFSDLGVVVKPRMLVGLPGSEGKPNIKKKEFIHDGCPSSKTKDGTKGIFYIPGRGLIQCCAGIAFHDLTPKEYYSDTARLSEDYFSKEFSDKSFSSYIANPSLMELVDQNYSSLCEACTDFHLPYFGGRSLQGLLTLDEDLNGLNKCFVSSSVSKKLLNLVGRIKPSLSLVVRGKLLEIEEKNLSLMSTERVHSDNPDVKRVVLDVFKKCYHSRGLSVGDQVINEVEAEETLLELLSLPDVMAYFLKKNEKIGGLIVIKPFKYDFFEATYLHMAFLGYQKEVLDAVDVKTAVHKLICFELGVESLTVRCHLGNKGSMGLLFKDFCIEEMYLCER